MVINALNSGATQFMADFEGGLHVARASLLTTTLDILPWSLPYP